MKCLIRIYLATVFIPLYPAPAPCKVSIESLWYELDANTSSQTAFGGKWVVIGKITFKNKTKESIKLDNLTLDWKGAPLASLMGTLYKADGDDTFLPTEHYVLADSIWVNTSQSLQFNFSYRYTVEPISTLYLVLTVPQALEPILNQGHFAIAAEGLPRQLKQFAQKNSSALTLTLDTSRKNSMPLKNTPKVSSSSVCSMHA